MNGHDIDYYLVEIKGISQKILILILPIATINYANSLDMNERLSNSASHQGSSFQYSDYIFTKFE